MELITMLASNMLGDILSPAAITIIAGAVTFAISRLLGRVRLSNEIDRHDLLSRIASDGVAIADEYAAVVINKELGVVSSAKKNSVAVTHMLDTAKWIDIDTAKRYVDGAVATTEGVGATSTLGISK